MDTAWLEVIERRREVNERRCCDLKTQPTMNQSLKADRQPFRDPTGSKCTVCRPELLTIVCCLISLLITTQFIVSSQLRGHHNTQLVYFCWPLNEHFTDCTHDIQFTSLLLLREQSSVAIKKLDCICRAKLKPESQDVQIFIIRLSYSSLWKCNTN